MTTRRAISSTAALIVLPFDDVTVTVPDAGSSANTKHSNDHFPYF